MNDVMMGPVARQWKEDSVTVDTTHRIPPNFDQRQKPSMVGFARGRSLVSTVAWCWYADIGLECLASWKDGSEMYFYGRLSGAGIVDKEDKYRCFVCPVYYSNAACL